MCAHVGECVKLGSPSIPPSTAATVSSTRFCIIIYSTSTRTVVSHLFTVTLVGDIPALKHVVSCQLSSSYQLTEARFLRETTIKQSKKRVPLIRGDHDGRVRAVFEAVFDVVLSARTREFSRVCRDNPVLLVVLDQVARIRSA